jgi:hypothetical protein
MIIGRPVRSAAVAVAAIRPRKKQVVMAVRPVQWWVRLHAQQISGRNVRLIFRRDHPDAQRRIAWLA